MLLSRNDSLTVDILPFEARLKNPKPGADPRIFSHDWPGLPRKDIPLIDLGAASQGREPLPTPIKKTGKRQKPPHPYANGRACRYQSPNPLRPRL